MRFVWLLFLFIVAVLAWPVQANGVKPIYVPDCSTTDPVCAKSIDAFTQDIYLLAGYCLSQPKTMLRCHNTFLKVDQQLERQQRLNRQEDGPLFNGAALEFVRTVRKAMDVIYRRVS